MVQSIRKFSTSVNRKLSGELRAESTRSTETEYSNFPGAFRNNNRFIATLSHDLRLLELKEFARLKLRRDSGPRTCRFPAGELRCDSGAKDPRHGVDVKVSMDLPYGVIWPLSSFLWQVLRAPRLRRSISRLGSRLCDWRRSAMPFRYFPSDQMG